MERNLSPKQSSINTKGAEEFGIADSPNEGEHRVYTLKGFEGIENHFKGALAEEGEGDTFEGLICVFKKNNGSIGIAFHVSSQAETVARTPEGGANQPEWFHYRPQGDTTGAFGRIKAEELKPKEIVLPEVGPGITHKLIALASSWCFGPYYCK